MCWKVKQLGRTKICITWWDRRILPILANRQVKWQPMYDRACLFVMFVWWALIAFLACMFLGVCDKVCADKCMWRNRWAEKLLASYNMVPKDLEPIKVGHSHGRVCFFWLGTWPVALRRQHPTQNPVHWGLLACMPPWSCHGNPQHSWFFQNCPACVMVRTSWIFSYPCIYPAVRLFLDQTRRVRSLGAQWSEKLSHLLSLAWAGVSSSWRGTVPII